MRRRLVMLVIAGALMAAAAPAPGASADPAPAGDPIRITVKARLTGWIGRRDGVFLYRAGSTARLVVGVWPTLPDEPVRARLEWRRAGNRWRLLEVTASHLSRDGRALFLVRGVPEGFRFRMRARVPPGDGHLAGRSPWRYFRAI